MNVPATLYPFSGHYFDVGWARLHYLDEGQRRPGRHDPTATRPGRFITATWSSH